MSQPIINGLTKPELGEIMRLYYRYRQWMPTFLARRLAAVVWGVNHGGSR